MSGCGARTAAGSLEAVLEFESDVERFGWTLMESVNGGVKAGHWGGAKTGQFAAWASSTTRHGRPGGDGWGFVAGAAVAFRNLG